MTIPVDVVNTGHSEPVLPTRRLWDRLDSVLLSLFFSVTAYALVFTYEFGYYQYFGLPPEMISLDWSSALNAISGLGLLIGNVIYLFSIVVLLAVIYDLRNEEFYKLRIVFFILLFFDISAIPWVSLNGFLAVNNAIVILVCIPFVTYWRSRKVSIPSGKLDWLANVVDFIMIPLGRLRYTWLIAIITLIFAVHDAGWNAAGRTSNFLVDVPSHQAVLAISNLTFVMAPYIQRPAQECAPRPPCFSYIPTYTFTKMPDHGSLTFMRKELGTLSIARVKSWRKPNWWGAFFFRER